MSTHDTTARRVIGKPSPNVPAHYQALNLALGLVLSYQASLSD